MKISLCITNYNRNAYLFKSFEQVLNDDRISEIVIVDDCSDLELYNRIEERCKYMNKVKLFRNEKNLGCYENKKVAVSKASEEYVIIFDSDNVIDTSYIDKIYSVEWNPSTILAPDFAQPVFDYRQYSGVTFNKVNVSQYALKGNFACLINTMNYFVHRDSYVAIWQAKEGIKGADSIYMNYLWLLAGNEINCLDGLHYFHRINAEDKTQHGSNYVEFAVDSAPQCDNIERLISLMR
jgi:glycosyltransferase involved in cell wall biosynthesis